MQTTKLIDLGKYLFARWAQKGLDVKLENSVLTIELSWNEPFAGSLWIKEIRWLVFIRPLLWKTLTSWLTAVHLIDLRCLLSFLPARVPRLVPSCRNSGFLWKPGLDYFIYPDKPEVLAAIKADSSQTLSHMLHKNIELMEDE